MSGRIAVTVTSPAVTVCAPARAPVCRMLHALTAPALTACVTAKILIPILKSVLPLAVSLKASVIVLNSPGMKLCFDDSYVYSYRYLIKQLLLFGLQTILCSASGARGASALASAGTVSGQGRALAIPRPALTATMRPPRVTAACH